MIHTKLFFSCKLLSSQYTKNRLENVEDSHDETIFEDLDLPIAIGKKLESALNTYFQFYLI